MNRLSTLLLIVLRAHPPRYAFSNSNLSHFGVVRMWCMFIDIFIWIAAVIFCIFAQIIHLRRHGPWEVNNRRDNKTQLILNIVLIIFHAIFLLLGRNFGEREPLRSRQYLLPLAAFIICFPIACWECSRIYFVQSRRYYFIRPLLNFAVPVAFSLGDLVNAVTHVLANKIRKVFLETDNKREQFAIQQRSVRYGKLLVEDKTMPFLEEPQDLREPSPYGAGFTDCSCCLGPPHPIDQDVDLSDTNWYLDRLEFLGQPSFNNHSDVQKITYPQPAHQLCVKCQRLCGRSALFIGDISPFKLKTLALNLLSYIPLFLGNPFWRYRSLLGRERTHEFKHWDTPQQLVDSAQNGCHLCTLICGQLNVDQRQKLLLEGTIVPLNPENQRTSVDGIWIRISSKPLRITPHFGHRKVPRYWAVAPRNINAEGSECKQESLSSYKYDTPAREQDSILIVSPKEESFRGQGPLILPLSSSTGSDTVMTIVQGWLHETEEVRNSSRLDQSRLLPTRLIDVQDYTETGKIRLCLQREILHERRKSEICYVALSHCWGGKPIFKLTTETEREFYQGLDIQKLAKSFRDAISVTFRLGFRYIWIDCLCIIQDSGTDWAMEAQTMKDVYRYAEFTIAAASAWDSSEGLFNSQQPLSLTPCLVRADSKNGQLKGLYAIPRANIAEDAENRDVLQSRLNHRAWVLQEQIMSPNVLYFGQTGLHWATRGLESNAFERPEMKHSQFEALADPNLNQKVEDMYKEKTPVLFDWSVRIGAKIRNMLSAKLETSGQSESNFQSTLSRYHTHYWWNVLNDYTRRGLTKGDDKLFALSGIAGLIQEKAANGGTSLQYVAGLWMESPLGDSLIAGMLWYVDLRRNSKRLTEYRAPSWSWASVDGIVANDSLEAQATTCGLEILDVVVVGPINPSSGAAGTMATPPPILFPLGQVDASTHITVRGKLRPAFWTEVAIDGNPRYYMAQSGKASDLQFHTNGTYEPPQSTSLDPSAGPQAYPLYAIHSNARSSQPIGCFLPDYTENLPSEIYCLQIKIQPYTLSFKRDPTKLWVTRGLALTPTNMGPGHFIRVGYFEIDRIEDKDLRWPTVFSGPLSPRVPYEPVRRRDPEIDPSWFFRDRKVEDIVIW